ncbi:ribonuclease HII [Lachnoanaerobaculum sp. MSX33]|uniref:ribonuclease HII n=1 Tax=Lachnoanaerobaculum TaxID=1164882 RepID=UPI0003DF9860|nr:MULTISPECIES: ribonuclease HII [unclassified Lachnoanaerobaculum]ETO99142.1 ribonuclease HII [Lachnoanaerobaculum sp. MSX33]GMO02817.1 ribonuclease HII [Lachnoanaerobaculum sp. JCM 36186]
MRKISEEKLALERVRLEGMREFENKYSDLAYVAGIDEAGRGPLAGPVVAAAVILPKDIFLPFLNDSKKVTEKRRDVLFDEIKQNAIAYGIGIASNTLIDEINILQATYEAMREAVNALEKTPDVLLVDAVHIPDINIKQVGIVKGDAKSVNIAAASILAKVTRDRLMAEYDKIYPEYGFASNKGYGTATHIAALKEIGPCAIHRKSFIGNFVSE